MSRIAATLRLIHESLFTASTPASSLPESPSAVPASVIPPAPLAIDPADVFVRLLAPGTPRDRGGTVRLFVPGVCFLAAPFVLFRLKRWGFSGCRVVVEAGGLVIEAQR